MSFSQIEYLTRASTKLMMRRPGGRKKLLSEQCRREAMQGYSAFANGMALGFGSVLSIGPNNLMLLREGLLRGRKWLVASTVCLDRRFRQVGNKLGTSIQRPIRWRSFARSVFEARQALPDRRCRRPAPPACDADHSDARPNDLTVVSCAWPARRSLLTGRRFYHEPF
jgi:hypothetical protein